MKKFPFQIIDLTHDLTPDMPSWSGGCGFQPQLKLDYADCAQNAVSFRVQQLKMHAGIGTHIDAPAHCVPGGAHVAQLSLQNLIAPCIRIDISNRCQANAQLTVDDIMLFEKIHGEISPETFILVETGWGQRYWHDRALYRNNHQFPSVSENAALFLLQKNVVGLGIDTLSPDIPSSNFPVHKCFLGAGKYLIENVANGHQVPAKGAYTAACPMKAVNLTEAPIRFFALVERASNHHLRY